MHHGDWFNEARYGLFIHWGPYAAWGRGEQVLMREWLDPRDYERKACRWKPAAFDARAWAREAKRGGFRYAVLTTRHHDGYCLWDTATTDYSSARQAPRRDFVREFVEAFRAEGLRVGLYYSWADFRIPAFYRGPAGDAAGWAAFREACHAQVKELLSNYGPIDVLWFDGAWPHSAETWRSLELLREIRRLQPGILVNNRLGYRQAGGSTVEATTGESAELGDFGTPEHHITADATRKWESCQVTTWRLWGYTPGERWRPAELWLDMLAECASKGGNLLLNVGPDPDGRLPREFVTRSRAVGAWLARHGEAIYGTDRHGEILDPVTYGRITRKGSTLYLVLRFYDRTGRLRVTGLAGGVKRATWLGEGRRLRARIVDRAVELSGLPREPGTPLFPVVKLELDGEPQLHDFARVPQWTGDPLRYVPWAEQRGESLAACRRR